MKKISIFLIMVALIAGIMGCNETDVEYDLTVASTAGGGVTTPGEGTFTYDEPEVVTLVAVADGCHEFVNWSGDVDTIADVYSASTNITVDADKSVTANFAVLSYNLTVGSTDGGEVTTPGEGAFTHDCGTVVDLVAEADECCRFANWTGDVDTVGNTTAAVTTVTINGDCSITANFEEEVVTFPDPHLEAAIREAINKPTGDIYPSDLAGLTELGASWAHIADLTGLECCKSLTRVGLYGNLISDISPLSSLIDLTYLHLGDNQISDISPLVDNLGLGGGDYVDVRYNPLSDDSINIYIPELEARGVTVDY